MDGMTNEEWKEYQERLSELRMGLPETLAYSTKQRVRLLADLIADRIADDLKSGTPLPHKIEQESKGPKARRADITNP